MSIVKLFHSFENRKIPGHNSLRRCPLYSSTICKSWILLFAVSIFALPNKSPPFRLSHFASEKLLNVYVLHFLDKQWLLEFVLLITVLNDWKKRCVSQRIVVGKQKTFTIFLGTIHGSHRESKLGLERLKKLVFAWILKKFISERKRVWPHTDPRSQRLVVQINQKDITRVQNPLNFIYYFLLHICQRSCRVPNSLVVPSFVYQVEGAVFQSRWARFCLHLNKYWVHGILHDSLFQDYGFCLIKCVQMFNIYVVTKKSRPEVNPRPSVEGADLLTIELTWHYNVSKYLWFILLEILAILLPVKMNEIEGTRPNSSSQAFARWNQEVKTSRMVFKYFSSGWILLVPKHSLLKYFTLTFTRHKSSKFEGSGPPLMYSSDHNFMDWLDWNVILKELRPHSGNFFV